MQTYTGLQPKSTSFQTRFQDVQAMGSASLTFAEPPPFFSEPMALVNSIKTPSPCLASLLDKAPSMPKGPTGLAPARSTLDGKSAIFSRKSGLRPSATSVFQRACHLRPSAIGVFQRACHLRLSAIGVFQLGGQLCPSITPLFAGKPRLSSSTIPLSAGKCRLP